MIVFVVDKRTGSSLREYKRVYQVDVINECEITIHVLRQESPIAILIKGETEKFEIGTG